MEALRNACMHGVWLCQFKSFVQLRGYTIKVPKGKGGSQTVDDRHFILPQQG